MASDGRPSGCERMELLHELMVRAGAAPDGEDHLHARAQGLLGHKSAVETPGVVDEVVEEPGAADGELLEGLDTAALDHPLSVQSTEPDRGKHRDVIDFVWRVLEGHPVAHRWHRLHLGTVGDEVPADDAVANPCC